MHYRSYIGSWGVCNFDTHSVHIHDRDKLDNYPFSQQWHKCIDIEEEYLVVVFSNIKLRIAPSCFVEVAPPDFNPFDLVSYISSKGKLEFGVIVGFGVLIKPYKRRVYQLIVKGKVKSTLYEKERLTLMEDTKEVLKQRENLSKTISHALRHEPNEYGLKLDQEGWAEMNDLIGALKVKSSEWVSLGYFDILKMIDLSKKKRHEVKVKRSGSEHKSKYIWFIRAKYGHSIDGKIYNEKKEPPDVLYHGTTDEALKDILVNGLKPMERQYVHLSGKISEAIRVGKRRQKSPRILKVKASQAFNNNVNFYQGNDQIWLSDEIAPEYIELLED